MASLNLQRLHVKYIGDATTKEPALPRRYTLTHSDQTGDLFLSIGREYDLAAISGLYTRFMRDEVLAEYLQKNDTIRLHVYCHVSGGIVFGFARWRYTIFQYHLPGVLEAFRYGDDEFLRDQIDFLKAPVRVHFRSNRPRFHRIEDWGILNDYKTNQVAYES
jgi:hypothetical protein